MADNQARIVFTAEDKTSSAIASLRASLAKSTAEADKLRNTFAALVPAVTVTGLAAFFKGVNDGVDALNDLKDATGASIENISALEDVALRTGTSFDTVGDSLIKFNQALTQADDGGRIANALKAIGLQAKDLKSIDPAEALRRTAVALAGYADDGNKARVVQELFGRSVKEVAPFLNDLATQTRLVGTVTAEQAEAAEVFNKSLAEMKKNSLDIARAFANDLVPAISQLTKEFKTGLSSANGFFDAVLTFGTINPFRSQAENIRAYSDELRELEQTRTNYLQRGFSTAAIDADIEDVRKKLAYLKQLQQEAALAGAGGSQSSAEARRLGLSTQDRPSVVDVGSKEAEEQLRKRKEDARQKEIFEALSKKYKDDKDSFQDTFAAVDDLQKRRSEEYLKTLDEMDRYTRQFASNTQGILADSIYNLDSDNILADFSDLLRRMAAEAAAANLTRAIFGAGSGGGFDFGSLFTGSGGSSSGSTTQAAGHHAGGIVGLEPSFMRSVDMSVFSQAKRYHSGGIVGSEVPAILQRGEGVFTPGQMKAMGGGNVSIEIQNYSGAQITRREETDGRGGRRFQFVIGDMSAAEMARSGSPQQNVMRVGYGLTPRPMRR